MAVSVFCKNFDQEFMELLVSKIDLPLYTLIVVPHTYECFLDMIFSSSQRLFILYVIH